MRLLVLLLLLLRRCWPPAPCNGTEYSDPI